MTSVKYGPHATVQLITFSTVKAGTEKTGEYTYITARKGDTIASICAARGRTDMIQEVLKLNGSLKLANGSTLRSSRQKLRSGDRVALPGTLVRTESLEVMPGNEKPPTIKDGYAMYDTVNRPARVGLNRFLGFNPIEMDVPIQFENYANFDGTEIEEKIEVLERMAGVGQFAGAQSGPPAVIEATCTNSAGNLIALIPRNYQSSKTNPKAPQWRIAKIEWAEGALRDDRGQRIRAEAVVTLKQYTPLSVVRTTLVQRSRARKSTPKPKGPTSGNPQPSRPAQPTSSTRTTSAETKAEHGKRSVEEARLRDRHP